MHTTFESFRLNERQYSSYEEYCASIDVLTQDADLLEGWFNKTVDAAVRLAGKVWSREKSAMRDAIADIAKHAKCTKEHVGAMLKSRNVYEVFVSFGFSITALVETVLAATRVLHAGLKQVFVALYETKVVQDLKSGAVKVDEVLERYPVLKKVTGPVLAGVLFLMWTESAFTGNMDADFDMEAIRHAFIGEYSIADLFVSPDGLLLITLFAVGEGLTLSWFGSTNANALAGLIYTAYKTGGKEMLVAPLKAMLDEA